MVEAVKYIPYTILVEDTSVEFREFILSCQIIFIANCGFVFIITGTLVKAFEKAGAVSISETVHVLVEIWLGAGGTHSEFASHAFKDFFAVGVCGECKREE